MAFFIAGLNLRTKAKKTHAPSTEQHLILLYQRKQGVFMLKWAIIFAIISLIAGVFGFTGVAAGAAGIAKILFFIFIAIAVIFVVLALLGIGAVS